MSQQRQDANGVFFEQQLTLIETKLFQKEYPLRKGRGLLPLDTQGGPGVHSRKWRMLDRAGIAQALSPDADDIPIVSLSGQEFEAKPHDFALGAKYSESDVEASRFAGTPVDSLSIMAVGEGYEDKVDDLIFSGEPDRGIQGMNDHPNVPIYTPGASSGPGDDTWPNKTAAEIITDVSSIMQGVRKSTLDLHAPNWFGMSPERLELMRSMPVGTNADRTILAYLQDVYKGVVFDSWYRLSTAGVGGVQRMMALQLGDADIAYFWEPQPLTRYNTYNRLFKYIVPFKGRIGGVILKRPLAWAFMDGI